MAVIFLLSVASNSTSNLIFSSRELPNTNLSEPQLKLLKCHALEFRSFLLDLNRCCFPLFQLTHWNHTRLMLLVRNCLLIESHRDCFWINSWTHQLFSSATCFEILVVGPSWFKCSQSSCLSCIRLNILFRCSCFLFLPHPSLSHSFTFPRRACLPPRPALCLCSHLSVHLSISISQSVHLSFSPPPPPKLFLPPSTDLSLCLSRPACLSPSVCLSGSCREPLCQHNTPSGWPTWMSAVGKQNVPLSTKPL